MPRHCLLCLSDKPMPLARVNGRAYFHCGECGLAFLEPALFPAPDAEVAHYRTHENNPDDTAYRAFLSRAIEPLVPLLAAGASGLDYGCGPGPAMSVMLRKRGFLMRDYDPFFRPDADALRMTYDFITCTETAEHFHDPRAEFERLDGLLRRGGHMALMTQLWDGDSERFAGWWYHRDPTHVCFYQPATLDWIARWRGWTVTHAPRGVCVFHKPERG